MGVISPDRKRSRNRTGERKSVRNDGANCGIGPGGFQPGNKCQKGGGGSVGADEPVLIGFGYKGDLIRGLTKGESQAQSKLEGLAKSKGTTLSKMAKANGFSDDGELIRTAAVAKERGFNTLQEAAKASGVKVGKDLAVALGVTQKSFKIPPPSLKLDKSKISKARQSAVQLRKLTGNRLRSLVLGSNLSLENVTANFSGGVQRRMVNGREYAVAKLNMIVPGVLHGSQGALYYPPDEVSKNPAVWNGVPLVVTHPRINGEPVSANDPEVLKRFGIGSVRNAKINKRGILTAEAWVDVKRAKRIDNRVLQAVQNGSPMEISTGLFTDNKPSKGVYNGQEYTHIARNYRPDHLAILPDEQGACSIKDGCGMNVNDSKKETINTKGAFMSKLSDKQRKQIIDNLIANCDCAKKEKANEDGPWAEEDREGLETLSDQKLQRLENQRVTANAKMPDFIKKKIKGKDEAMEDEEDMPEGKSKKKAAMNQQSDEAPKEPTLDEWLKTAPKEVRETVTNSIRFEQQQKEKLVEQIVTNERNDFSEDWLMTLPLDQLEGMAKLAAPTESAAPAMFRRNYQGQAAPATNRRSQEDEEKFRSEDHDMAPPTINYSEWAKDRQTG